jgi:hypothetical protein
MPMKVKEVVRWIVSLMHRDPSRARTGHGSEDSGHVPVMTFSPRF